MRQHEAVIKVMEENGGYATLGFLNQNVLKIAGCEWKTKTPFASIRRIVQDERYFFKIRPGLWALNSYKNKLPFDILPPRDVPKQKYETFVPNQDKNNAYLGKKLGEITTATEFYRFTYEHIIQRIRSVDVIWFNVRKMPTMLFEVEHSTDIKNSLSKFVELQDFYTDFRIVAAEIRKKEFEAKLSLEVFRPIHNRAKFLSYDDVSSWHARMNELATLESNLAL